MTLDTTQLVLFAIFTTSLHWLIARSEIAKPLWSRATGWFAKLLSCPACSGFWLGGLIAFSGYVTPITLDDGINFIAVRTLVGGLLGVFVTPIAEGVLVWGLLQSAIEGSTSDEDGAVPAQAAPQTNSAAITPADNFVRKPKP